MSKPINHINGSSKQDNTSGTTHEDINITRDPKVTEILNQGEKLIVNHNQLEKIKDLKVGERDAHNETIKRIFAVGNGFMIYEVDSQTTNLLKLYTDDNNKEIQTRFDKVRAEYNKVRSLLHKTDPDYDIKSIVASILANALSGNVRKARKEFKLLQEDINTEFTNRFTNKLFFLFTNIIICLTCIVFSIYVYINLPLFGQYTSIRNLTFMLTCASIGGAFSLSYKINNIKIIKGTKPSIYIFYGIERTFISIASGFILFLAIKADFVFTFADNDIIKNDPNAVPDLFKLFFLATAAGFSETFVPDLLVSLEKKK
jgi:hypothetical protein